MPRQLTCSWTRLRHRRIALAIAIILTALASTGCGDLAGLTQFGQFQRLTTTSELETRQLLGQRVRRILKAEQFDRLDQFADSLQAGNLVYPSGVPFVIAFYRQGFGEVNDATQPEQWAQHLQLLRRWEDARPTAIAPRIALAQALIARGWKARGEGVASTVSAQDAGSFESNLSEAMSILRQCPAAAHECPAWHDAAMNALHGIGREVDTEYREVFAEAAQRFPTYARWYTGMAQHLMPRWYGDAGELEQFADTCAAALSDTLRDEIYARIAADQCKNLREVFKAYPAYSWPRVQRGINAWERNHSESLDPLSARARLAYYAKDRTVAREAFRQLGDRVDLDVWDNEFFFLAARKWAFGKEEPPHSS